MIYAESLPDNYVPCLGDIGAEDVSHKTPFTHTSNGEHPGVSSPPAEEQSEIHTEPDNRDGWLVFDSWQD